MSRLLPTLSRSPGKSPHSNGFERSCCLTEQPERISDLIELNGALDSSAPSPGVGSGLMKSSSDLSSTPNTWQGASNAQCAKSTSPFRLRSSPLRSSRQPSKDDFLVASTSSGCATPTSCGAGNSKSLVCRQVRLP